jgi:hypothetical protein
MRTTVVEFFCIQCNSQAVMTGLGVDEDNTLRLIAKCSNRTCNAEEIIVTSAKEIRENALGLPNTTIGRMPTYTM